MNLLTLFGFLFFNNYTSYVNLLTGYSCFGNSAVKSDTCEIKILTYAKQSNGRIVEKGIVIRKSYVPCDIYWREYGCSLTLGRNRESDMPEFQISCVDVDIDRLVNIRKNGYKVGLWLKFYPWGGIRKATTYRKGEVYKMAIFRPNGNLVKYYTLRKSGKSMQVSLYDKRGFAKSNISVFD